MKKLYTLVARTKSESAAGVPPLVVPPAGFQTLQGAKAAARSALNAGTVSYAEIYGPEAGVVFRLTNPAGA